MEQPAKLLSPKGFRGFESLTLRILKIRLFGRYFLMRRVAKHLSALREGFESRSDVSRARETARQGRAAKVVTTTLERLTELTLRRIEVYSSRCCQKRSLYYRYE